jgi:hypothetical protein
VTAEAEWFSSHSQMTCWTPPIPGWVVGLGVGFAVGPAVGRDVGPTVDGEVGFVVGRAVLRAPDPGPEGVDDVLPFEPVGEPDEPPAISDPVGSVLLGAGPPARPGPNSRIATMATTTMSAPMAIGRSALSRLGGKALCGSVMALAA